MIKQFPSLASRAIAATALAAGLATASLPALAAGQTQDTEMVTAIGGWTNPNMARLASSSGRLLIERIEAAKNMIDMRQFSAARNELDAAQDTAGAIRTMMPFITVIDDIRDVQNKVTLGDVEHFRDDLLPIYTSLDRMSVYAPTLAKDTRKKVKEAEAKAQAGKAKEASSALDEACEFITESAVYLPIGYVYDQVSIAHAALTGPEPNPGPARRAVDNALHSLIAVVTTLESEPKA